MKNSDNNALNRIGSLYYDLTSSEKKIADYIMSQHDSALNKSISELAAASGVAEATITRFSRTLGYKGYNDFKIELAKSSASINETLNPLSGEVVDSDSFDEVAKKLYSADVSAITQTYQLLDENQIRMAVDLLENARIVYCMGQGGSMVIAEDTAHLFTTCFNNFFPVSDNHYQAITAAKLEPEDVILYFSYSGATVDMMQTLSLSKKRGAKTILITHFINSPGAALADVVLQCGVNESPLQLGSVAAKISQLYLMDVLFSELCIRDLDNCRKYRWTVADALADKHL